MIWGWIDDESDNDLTTRNCLNYQEKTSAENARGWGESSRTQGTPMASKKIHSRWLHHACPLTVRPPSSFCAVQP